jgi:hypothetical protein
MDMFLPVLSHCGGHLCKDEIEQVCPWVASSQQVLFQVFSMLLSWLQLFLTFVVNSLSTAASSSMIGGIILGSLSLPQDAS